MSQEPIPGSESGFEGGAFHPDLENGRASGTVRVSVAGVHFESAKGSFEFSLTGVQITLGGASDRLIFFNHPSQPNATIHTADHSILKHPLLLQRPDLTSQIGKVHSRKRTAILVLLSVVLLLVGSIAGLVLSREALVKTAANSIPVDWEVSLGDKLFDQLTKSERFIRDTNLDAQLKLITDPLVTGIKDSRYPFKFHIVEDATLNAFAVPGGHVVLHSGLLLEADSPEEVAGVLAHEIAHVTRRHGFRSIISSLGIYTVIQAVIGDVGGIIAVIGNNSAFLIDRKFSRDFEREADAAGWDYLLEANIEPRGMIEFFRKLQLEEGKFYTNAPAGTESALSFVSTHPATRERMETLEAKARALKPGASYRRFELNYDSFKASLRTKLHSAPNSERN